MSHPSESIRVRCRVCGQAWPESYRVCPTDGSDLTEVTAFAQTPAPEPNRATTPLPIRQRHADLAAGTLVGEHYEVEGKLGEGAMGAVYAAVHRGLGKRVAIKVIAPKLCLDPTALERFEQEARTLAQLAHPGIVDVSNLGTLPDGRSYFVMEWLRGEDLRARLERGRLPLGEALDVLDQIARALEAAHARGVIHRDLKPENTFLVQLPGEPPIVKLLDFGLAKLAGSDDLRVAKTSSGQLLGTPYYMSPEQARGKGVDHRTDIYALGCIAYELVCGQVPFEADNAAELIAMHLHAAPPVPCALWPETPPALHALLYAMVAKESEHRPGLADVRAVLRSDQARETPEVARRHPRRGLIVGLVAGTITALVMIVAVAQREDPEPPSDKPAGFATPDAGPSASALAYPSDAGVPDAVPPDAQPDAKVRTRQPKRKRSKPDAAPTPPRDPRDRTVDPFQRRPQ